MTPTLKTIREKNRKEFDEKFPQLPPSFGKAREIARVKNILVPELKSFLTSSEDAIIEGVREMIERLEVGKPRSESEEIPYDIKKAWLEETKAVILAYLKDK